MEDRPPYDARAVANLLLDMADQRGQPLTQMSLLKIMYFAHGWFLAMNNMPLVRQDFEAWEYGPVVKVIRDEFKNFKKEPITSRAQRLDIYTGTRELVKPLENLEHVDFVKSIYEFYHVYDAWKLSEMTHEEGSPWDALWNADRPTGRLALRIRNEDIKDHFNGFTQRFRVSLVDSTRRSEYGWRLDVKCP